ncbi:MAG: ABC transporter ATP-binding protein [Verrucomicrobiota bacterium]
MPEEPLIVAENVGKKFCRSLKKSLFYGVKDIGHAVNPFSNDGSKWETGEAKPPLRDQEFWAVSDINFSLKRGDCLGLVGHNGAGKSTLLKILNQLIKPDTGRITMRGRVCALIELSAGFSPILTGRENIYNQGALLGISKREITKCFDEIVDFAEIAPAIDTPVQNYSSGMKVRLGFAVAAQLKPDVLLLDEVLAVGDVGFRHKCLSAMSNMLKNSAVVFVSHSMPQILRVCNHMLVMKKGEAQFNGADVGKGVETYFNLFGSGESSVAGSGEIEVIEAKVTTATDTCQLEGNFSIPQHGKFEVETRIRIKHDLPGARAQVLFWNQDLIPVLDVVDRKENAGYYFDAKQGETTLKLTVDSLSLNPGRYQLSLIFVHPNLERTYCQYDRAFCGSVAGESPSGAGVQLLADWQSQSVR